MRYWLSEIKVTRPPAASSFATGETGMGLLVLPHWRPIGFLIRANARKRTRPLQHLSLWIGGQLKTKLAKEEVHYEPAVKASLLAPVAWPRANISFGLKAALQQHADLGAIRRLLTNLRYPVEPKGDSFHSRLRSIRIEAAKGIREFRRSLRWFI